MKRLQELPTIDRPRERLLKQGPSSLSDQELIALMLGTGTNRNPLMTMAAKILKCVDRGGAEVTYQQLCEIEGVGPVRAMLVLAAMEFARRRINPAGNRIHLPTDLLPQIRHYAQHKQEHFLCTTLNGANEVIATRVVSIGLIDQTQIHPREVFAQPLTDLASSVIFAHNHPSGQVQPSKSDLQTTSRLVEAGYLLGIRVLDHIIFSEKDYFSFAEQDLITSPNGSPLETLIEPARGIGN